MLPRVLEPEVMDTAEEAPRLRRDGPPRGQPRLRRRLPRRLGRAGAPSSTSAPARPRSPSNCAGSTRGAQVDGHRPGRAHAAGRPAEDVARAGLAGRIQLWHLVDAKGLPFADGTFAAVMSNSIVHHIPGAGTGPGRDGARCWRPGGLAVRARPAAAATTRRRCGGWSTVRRRRQRPSAEDVRATRCTPR